MLIYKEGNIVSNQGLYWVECTNCGCVRTATTSRHQKDEVCLYCHSIMQLSDINIPIEQWKTRWAEAQEYGYNKYVAGDSQKEEFYRDSRARSSEEYEKHMRERNESTTHIPKCPTCSSTDIRKVDGLERGVSVVAWGLFSSKINKTFKCNSCGYTW